MIRKTLTILSLIRLLLSVVLWGVSYFNVWCAARTQDYSDVGATHRALAARQGSCQMFIIGSQTPLPVLTWRGFWNFDTKWDFRNEGCEANVCMLWSFPLWLPTLLFFSMFLLRFIPFYRRRKRKKLGLCLKCGYDLRASKDRCPECGEEFVSTGVKR